MIPKKIHYCWFGNSPLPSIVEKCINSWKEIMPDYEVIRWDETNVPYQEYNFMREAYSVKKYAFVSDQARYLILKEHGGFFLDTDVEVIKRLDDLRENKCFFAFNKHVKRNVLFVNPGLIMGAEKNNKTIDEIFKIYCNIHFLVDGVAQFKYSSPRILTNYLLKFKGLKIKDEYQKLPDDIKVYATDYFDPMNPRTIIAGSKIEITSNTYSIHYGAASWIPFQKKFLRVISIILRNILGDDLVDKIRGKEQQCAE